MPKAARKSAGRSKSGLLTKSPLSVVQNASSDEEPNPEPVKSVEIPKSASPITSSAEKTKSKPVIKKVPLSQVINTPEQEPTDQEMTDPSSPSAPPVEPSGTATPVQPPAQAVAPPEYYDFGESIDLGMYLNCNPPTLYQLPSELIYSTSFLVATIQPHQSANMRPIATEDDTIGQFREELFNIGNILASTEESKKAIHRPSFYSTLGDYVFASPKDRDIALRHGFTDEKDMFDWLNRLLGCGHYLDKEKFETPWHDIEMRFIPRHRNSNEDDKALAKGKGRAKAKAEPAETNGNADTKVTFTDPLHPGSAPSPSTHSPMTNGVESVKAKRQRRSLPAIRAPTPPDGDEIELPHTINLDHLITAVVRHPLLFPAYPVSADFLVRHSPHQLTDNSLLYVLSHGKMENENLSDKLRELGMYVAANVITHRKKKALKLLPNGDKNYEHRKKQFDLYKRSIERAL